LEDQLHGGKKVSKDVSFYLVDIYMSTQCGHLGGKVLVPTSTHISRLIAARFQLDLMKSTMLLIARTDSECGKLISSNVDVSDHEFIVGTTTKSPTPLAQVLAEAEAKGATGAEVDSLEKKWLKEHELCTFNEGMISYFCSTTNLQ